MLSRKVQHDQTSLQMIIIPWSNILTVLQMLQNKICFNNTLKDKKSSEIKLIQFYEKNKC